MQLFHSHLQGEWSGAAWNRTAVPRGGLRLVVTDGDELVLVDERERVPGWTLALVLRFQRGGVDEAVLLTAASGGGTPVLRNGVPVHDVVALRDRDELSVGGTRLLFASGSACGVRVLDEDDVAEGRRPCCARCRLALLPGDEVVACEGCSALHHEGATVNANAAAEQMPCRSYAAACGACGRTRDELLWAPDDPDAV